MKDPVVPVRPASAVETSTDGAASTVVPRIKLTLRLSSAAGAPGDQSKGPSLATAQYSRPSSTPPSIPSTPSKPVVSKGKGKAPAAKRKAEGPATPSTVSIESSKKAKSGDSLGPLSTKTITDPSERPESLPRGGSLQFPEQVAFVRSQQAIKVRPWRQVRAGVATLGGSKMQVLVWAREGKTGEGTNEGIITRKPSSDLLTEPADPATPLIRQTGTFLPTFVCTFEECHKIFDSRDKWRRHQITHKRKQSAAPSAEDGRPIRIQSR